MIVVILKVLDVLQIVCPNAQRTCTARFAVELPLLACGALCGAI
jgi:hypothetical protein